MLISFSFRQYLRWDPLLKEIKARDEALVLGSERRGAGQTLTNSQLCWSQNISSSPDFEIL